MSVNDPPLPRGATSYLRAFDRYLAAVSAHDVLGQLAAREQMRDRLDTMLAGDEPEARAGRRGPRWRRVA